MLEEQKKIQELIGVSQQGPCRNTKYATMKTTERCGFVRLGMTTI